MSTENDDENLSPEEVAALSEAFAPGEARSSDEVRSDQEPIVLKYDLIGASAGQRHDFPALDLIHETFAAHANLALLGATNASLKVSAPQPEMLNFSEIYASLSAPCAVIVVDVDGLGTTGLMAVDPAVLMHIVDLMMGGSGAAIDASDVLKGRSFTRTEEHLIENLTQLLSEALKTAWADVTPVALHAKRAEVDPRHAAIFMPSDRMIEFKIELAWEEVKGDIRLVLPMIALRPFEQRLTRTAVSPPNQSDELWREAMRETLEDVPVHLTGVLGRTNLTIEEILKLEAGDLLRLDRDPVSPLELLVEGIPRYAIMPGVNYGNIAAIMVGPTDTTDGGDARRVRKSSLNTPNPDPDSDVSEEVN
jgi:flagellar motor switch protein FliM